MTGEPSPDRPELLTRVQSDRFPAESYEHGWLRRSTDL